MSLTKGGGAAGVEQAAGQTKGSTAKPRPNPGPGFAAQLKNWVLRHGNHALKTELKIIRY